MSLTPHCRVLGGGCCVWGSAVLFVGQAVGVFLPGAYLHCQFQGHFKIFDSACRVAMWELGPVQSQVQNNDEADTGLSMRPED